MITIVLNNDKQCMYCNLKSHHVRLQFDTTQKKLMRLSFHSGLQTTSYTLFIVACVTDLAVSVKRFSLNMTLYPETFDVTAFHTRLTDVSVVMSFLACR